MTSDKDKLTHTLNKIIASVRAEFKELEAQLTCPNILDEPIEELEWTVRVSNTFLNERILTLRDLIKRSESDLLRFPNFGRRSLNEVKEELARLGLCLRNPNVQLPPEEPINNWPKVKELKIEQQRFDAMLHKLRSYCIVLAHEINAIKAHINLKTAPMPLTLDEAIKNRSYGVGG